MHSKLIQDFFILLLSLKTQLVARRGMFDNNTASKGETMQNGTLGFQWWRYVGNIILNGRKGTGRRKETLTSLQHVCSFRSSPDVIWYIAFVVASSLYK